MGTSKSYQRLQGNDDLHRSSLREIYPAGFLLPEEGSRPSPVSSSFYTRHTRVDFLSKYGAILFPDRIRWQLNLPKKRKVHLDVFFRPVFRAAPHLVTRMPRHDFVFVSTTVDRRTGKGKTRYLGRASLDKHADAVARWRRCRELEREILDDREVDGPDRWMVSVDCHDLYDRSVSIDQPQRRRVIFTREGTLQIELNDVLQSAPFQSPDSLIRATLSDLFEIGILGLPPDTRDQDRAATARRLIDDYVRIGRYDELELTVDLASTLLVSNFSEIKRRYAACREGKTRWRIREPGSIYRLHSKTTAKGIVYHRTLKDLAEGGKAFDDTDIARYLRNAATASRGPLVDHSMQVFRFEQVVPRAVLKDIPVALFDKPPLELLGAIVDLSGGALEKLFRPLSDKDKTSLWNAVSGFSSQGRRRVGHVSERRFRSELLPLLFATRSLYHVAELEGVAHDR
jgi:hypothetical protein